MDAQQATITQLREALLQRDRLLSEARIKEAKLSETLESQEAAVRQNSLAIQAEKKKILNSTDVKPLKCLTPN